MLVERTVSMGNGIGWGEMSIEVKRRKYGSPDSAHLGATSNDVRLTYIFRSADAEGYG